MLSKLRILLVLILLVVAITTFHLSGTLTRSASTGTIVQSKGKLQDLNTSPNVQTAVEQEEEYADNDEKNDNKDEESILASDGDGSTITEKEEVDTPQLIGKNSSIDTVTPDTQKEGNPFTVAYAASFIKCDDPSSSGLVDASLILRHSIHKISSRNPESGSKYDYKMYAIVHRTQAIGCLDIIEQLGFEIIVVDPPFKLEDIQDDQVRDWMPHAACCGHHEFIKLYAFNLTEEIFVHVDHDFSFQKPMDHLFDAMLYEKESPEGKEARGKLELQYPNEVVLPDRIQAYITRDWGQVAPNKNWKSGYQAGFMVGRRNPSMIEDVSKVVCTHKFVGNGMSFLNGWGGLGYCDYIVGARAMQGTMAYFYDVIRPNTTVELNACRYNHLGMDMRYREDGPNFEYHNDSIGMCRDNRETCEQCRITPVEDIYSVHYAPCGKPWRCTSKGTPLIKRRGNYMQSPSVDPKHCLELQKLWHGLRSDFENELFARTGDETLKKLSGGEFMPDVFMGHCKNDSEYISLLEFSDDVVQLANTLYN